MKPKFSRRYRVALRSCNDDVRSGGNLTDHVAICDESLCTIDHLDKQAPQTKPLLASAASLPQFTQFGDVLLHRPISTLAIVLRF